jgi:hypothetical protein
MVIFQIWVRIRELQTFLQKVALSSSISEPQIVSIFRKNLDFCPVAKSLYINLYTWTARKEALVQGYCVYEKKKNREIKNPKQIKMKNGRFAVKGTCASCGKPIFRIGKLQVRPQ